MTQEDIFDMMPDKPLSRDAWFSLVALDALVKRIEKANDLQAVFVIKDSTEFIYAKKVVAKMEARSERN